MNLAMSSESYHEAADVLSTKTKDMHRAIVSLKEELDAVDWYQQRAEGCTDDELRAVLTHNKNEEIEHAMMVLEWIRRNDPTFQGHVGTYLNTTGPITAIEAAAARGGGGEGAGPGGSMSAGSPSLGIGSLKAVK
jgi:ferritin-like protein